MTSIFCLKHYYIPPEFFTCIQELCEFDYSSLFSILLFTIEKNYYLTNVSTDFYKIKENSGTLLTCFLKEFRDEKKKQSVYEEYIYYEIMYICLEATVSTNNFEDFLLALNQFIGFPYDQENKLKLNKNLKKIEKNKRFPHYVNINEAGDKTCFIDDYLANVMTENPVFTLQLYEYLILNYKSINTELLRLLNKQFLACINAEVITTKKNLQKKEIKNSEKQVKLKNLLYQISSESQWYNLKKNNCAIFKKNTKIVFPSRATCNLCEEEFNIRQSKQTDLHRSFQEKESVNWTIVFKREENDFSLFICHNTCLQFCFLTR